MKQSFVLIGMDDSPAPRFPDGAREEIGRGKVFSGGGRHHDLVKSLLPEGHEWISVTAPVGKVIDRYREVFAREEGTPIVVFASGDPLFFGFAGTLMRELPDAELKLYPAFNSLQQLAHRVPMRYDDMRTVSLTGRPFDALDRALIERAAKIGVLTDRRHTPAVVASRLLEYGYDCYVMHVGEHLGHAGRERVRRMTLREAAGTDFEHPNCLVLEASHVPPRPFGIPDGAFELLDGRSRMITKMPVRLLDLQALELSRRHVLWDIGFCTGSVSIEARLQFPGVRVVAFEARPTCERLMDINSRRFGAPGIQTLMGDFLDADIQSLPAPDAVFVGGHGGRLREMLLRVKEVLLPGGCVVFNSVSPESRTLFEAGACEAGLDLQACRRVALDDYNPVTIMKASIHT